MELDKNRTIIMNRGTATYRHGKLDFSHGEGGNNHIYCYDGDGREIGYIWFDTHCDYYGFCGKSDGSCNGVFREVLQRLYPKQWERSGFGYSLFSFTEESFAKMMEEVIAKIR